MRRGEPRADQVAVRMIGRALDMAVRPDIAHIVETTGMPHADVEHLIARMVAARRAGNPPPVAASPQRPQQEQRRAPANTTAVVPEPADETLPGEVVAWAASPDDPAVMLTWALEHPDPQLRATAENLTASLRRAARHWAHRTELAERRARIAALRAELDQLRGITRTICPDCGTPNLADLTRHRTAKHAGGTDGS